MFDEINILQLVANHQPAISVTCNSKRLPSVAPQPQKDQRERADDYTGEVIRTTNARIVSCKDGLQWILQTRCKPSNRRTNKEWRNLSYHLTAQSLGRAWDELQIKISGEQS